jgi:sulfatase modifying factor 1
MQARLLQARTASGMAAGFMAFSVLVSCDIVKGSSDGSPADRSHEPPAVKPLAPYMESARPQHAAAPRRAPGAPATGTAPAPPKSEGCPENMAREGRFCIDAYEVSLFERSTGSAHPYYQHPPKHMHDLEARSLPGVYPQGYLSQNQSKLACENAGKRLCTLEEWQAACKGNGRTFPYGNEAESGRCNSGKRNPHILDKFFPDIPHLKRTGREFNDPRLLQDPDYLMRAGSLPDCSTPEGVMDIDGNLSEWVADTVEKDGMTHGTFAGDAFSGYGTAGCGRWTNAHAADYYDYSMGTRCCKDAR